MASIGLRPAMSARPVRKPAPPPEIPFAELPKPKPKRWVNVLIGAALFCAGALTKLGLDVLPPQEAVAGLSPTTADLGTPESRGMRAVIDALRDRERALDRRERSIETREADLRQVEADLQARMTELSALRDELKVLLDASDVAREERVKGLVKMVEAMRPNQAAEVFAALDDELAVDVLKRMNKAKAGKALAAMDPARASVLAEMMTRAPIEEVQP